MIEHLKTKEGRQKVLDLYDYKPWLLSSHEYTHAQWKVFKFIAETIEQKGPDATRSEVMMCVMKRGKGFMNPNMVDEVLRQIMTP